MNLRHLLIFKTVVDTGSFTKAAKQLFITQSGVSHAIRELEQQTNAVLFDRLSKAIILTPAGKLLLEKVIAANGLSCRSPGFSYRRSVDIKKEN